MNKYISIGILISLAVIAASLFHIAFNQSGINIVNKMPIEFRKENLKKGEAEYLERINSSLRREDYKAKRIKNFEQQRLNLTNPDICKIFNSDVPLDKPHMATSYIDAWAALALTDIMTFGFNDYKARFSMTSNYFTKRGWESFSQALTRSRIVEMVGVNQQIVTSSPKAAPILQSQGVVNGVHQWVMEVPLILTYRSGAKTSNTGLLVTVIIKRSDDENNPCGLGIDQWIAVAR